jgi:hypothetical protein
MKIEVKDSLSHFDQRLHFESRMNRNDAGDDVFVRHSTEPGLLDHALELLLEDKKGKNTRNKE